MNVTDLPARLARRVHVAGECWEWTGRRKDGYGQTSHRSRTVIAHRLAYELLVGPVPEGMVLDHLCRNRGCVNPSHLDPVTQAENNRRAGAAKTSCIHGHKYTPENTYWRPLGSRECRTCRALSIRGRAA